MENPLHKIPGIPLALEKRVVNAISHFEEHLNEGEIAIIRIDRINKPPRRFQHFIVKLKNYKNAKDIIKPAKGPLRIEMDAWSHVLGDLANELLRKWPEGSEPNSIGLITDSKTIVFNAGRPEANGMEWYEDHLEGKSQAAIVAGEIENPLQMHWIKKGEK